MKDIIEVVFLFTRWNNLVVHLINLAFAFWTSLPYYIVELTLIMYILLKSELDKFWLDQTIVLEPILPELATDHLSVTK